MTFSDSMDVSIASGSDSLAQFCTNLCVRAWNVHFEADEDTRLDTKLPFQWKGLTHVANTGVTPEKRLLQAHLRSKLVPPTREYWASQPPAFTANPQPPQVKAQGIDPILSGYVTQAGFPAELFVSPWADTAPPSPEVSEQRSPCTDSDSDTTCDESWLGTSPLTMFTKATTWDTVDTPEAERRVRIKQEDMKVETGCMTPPFECFSPEYVSGLANGSVSFMDRPIDLTLSEMDSISDVDAEEMLSLDQDFFPGMVNMAYLQDSGSDGECFDMDI